MIKKTLVYFLYCNDQWTEIPEIYYLHLRLLKTNIHIFNEYKFILAFNDLNNKKLINYYKKLISEKIGLKQKDINFIIVQNDPVNREGIYFYKEIIQKLEEYDGLVFFGHGKIDLHFKKILIYKWVAGCHFINFYDIKDVEDKLIYNNYIAYGALPSKMITPDERLLVLSCYDGSFFWLNPKRIIQRHLKEVYNYRLYFDFLLNKQFIEKYNINIYAGAPFRFATENFFTDICHFDDECTTLNNIDYAKRYIYGTKNHKVVHLGYHTYSMENSVEVSKNLTLQQIEEFHKYMDEISQELNIKY